MKTITAYQNVLNATKAVVKGKFTAVNAYINKDDRPQTNNVTLHLKGLENKEQIKPRASRRKEISLEKRIEK